MSLSRRTALLGAGTGAAALGGLGFLAQRHLARQIAADPLHKQLRRPAEGDPLEAISADGTRLHAERFGAAEGPLVVLIPGWTETIGYWTPVLAELERAGIGALVYDLRGHGRSGRAEGGEYALARFGEDLEAVLEAAAEPGRPVVIAGHSLGAMSIAAWAEHHDVPARVAAAALMNTGVGELIAESLLVPVPQMARAVSDVIAVRGFLGARAPLPRFSTPLSHAAIRYAAFGPGASPAQVAFYERMLVATPPSVRADVGIAMSRMDLYHALANLTVPTAVIAGEKDRLTPPSHARRIAEMLPQPHSLTILPGTGHMGPLERPREIADLLVELAAGTSPSGRDAADGAQALA
jgi:pimeloyl-ACP methyl ester carboxylesterase